MLRWGLPGSKFLLVDSVAAPSNEMATPPCCLAMSRTPARTAIAGGWGATMVFPASMDFKMGPRLPISPTGPCPLGAGHQMIDRSSPTSSARCRPARDRTATIVLSTTQHTIAKERGTRETPEPASQNSIPAQNGRERGGCRSIWPGPRGSTIPSTSCWCSRQP